VDIDLYYINESSYTVAGSGIQRSRMIYPSWRMLRATLAVKSGSWPAHSSLAQARHDGTRHSHTAEVGRRQRNPSG